MPHSRNSDSSGPKDIRPEIIELLRQGKGELLSAMSDTPRVLTRGEALVQMADPHEYVYCIESGWFSRSRITSDGRRQIILIFLPGDICGIKSLFMAHEQDAIEALNPASVRGIHYDHARDMAIRDSRIAMYFAWRFAQDERRLHNWVVRLGRASGEERLASLLLELRSRLDLLGMSPSGVRYTFPLTRQQIADHIGVTRVHASRMLQRFREQNMVSIHNYQMVFLENSNALEVISRPVFDEIGSINEDV